MQAARLLSTIKQNKDARGPRLMAFETHNCANLCRFARISHLAKLAESNSVTNPELMHFTNCNQVFCFFGTRKIKLQPNLGGGRGLANLSATPRRPTCPSRASG